MRDHSKRKKVAVGLSGGVDSAVAARLLKEQGYSVTGVYMQCWEAKADGCKADEDRADAVKVAAHLDIPFKHLHFERQYKEKVIDYFYAEYKAGRTPNPDVMCNREIKFGLFFDWAVRQGFDFVASGHYARIRGTYLFAGIDETKDQSYFLHLLPRENMSRVLFPLGEMRKSEIRKLAEQINLPIANKPESMGICFIGEVDIKEFLKKEISPCRGVVVDKNGEAIGSHDGMAFYTIGQRHGFMVNKYCGLPLYVIGKNVEKNELVVGFGKDGLRDSFRVSKIHWLVDDPKLPLTCRVRIRHLGDLHPACLTFCKNDTVLVALTDSVFGVAAGQSAVFYGLGGIVFGGGAID